MNNNTIANQETPIEKTPEMNDCDFLNDMLSTEKSISDGYAIAINEASNDKYYSDLLNIFKETKDQARALFNLSFAKGWYKLEKADENKMSTKYNEYQQKQSEI